MKLRKNFLFISALVLSFFAFFFLGRSGVIVSPSASTLNSQPDLIPQNLTKLEDRSKGKAQSAQSLKSALAANRATLFSYLFSDAFKIELANKETFSLLTQKFSEKYPKEEPHHSFAFQSELATRLNILKAMQRPDAMPETFEKNFLAWILKNKHENWLVKRQALQNLRGQMNSFTERERATLISLVDVRTRALASKTEEEILSASLERAREK